MTLVPTLRAVVLGALVLAACADTADPVAATDPTVPPTAAPTTTAPPPTVAPTTTTTLAPTTTAPPVTTTLAPTTTTTTPATTTTTTTTTTSAAGPPGTGTLVHGGFAWAVYVGVWDVAPDQAALDEAAAPARAAGYEVTGWSDGGCDQGSAAALGVDPNGTHYVAALYFETEADAQGAAAAIGEGVEAVAEVQTYCLD